MSRYNAATWLLDRHVESGPAERTAYRFDGRGPSLAAGYGKNGAVDPFGAAQGWLAIGDVCASAERGSLVFLGRSDDMISVDGVRAPPAQVEIVLAEHPDVLEAARAAGSPLAEASAVQDQAPTGSRAASAHTAQ